MKDKKDWEIIYNKKKDAEGKEIFEKIENIKTRNISIIGENGSGKSTLFQKILENNLDSVDYIRAQRSVLLKFGAERGKKQEDLVEEEHSINNVRGSVDLKREMISNTDFMYEHRSPRKSMSADFNMVIELLIRKRNLFNNTWVGEEIPEGIDNELSKVINLWNYIFSDLRMNYDAESEKLIIEKNSGKKYDAEDLSDGEKSALYIISKITLSKKDIILIDEPESFLNTAITVELFDLLEKKFPDKKFTYFSHDLNFINSRENNTLFWIKSFIYSDIFEIEEIEKDEKKPQDLIIKLIGSKKQKILFIEGKGSDERLYKILYPDFKVQSVGSCENVINYTKSFNQSTENFNKEYFGLIDRDFRSNKEIKDLEENKIFIIPFAIFENLFFSENIIRFYLKEKGEDETKIDETIKKAKESIINLIKGNRFKNAYKKYHLQQYFNQNLDSFDLTKSLKFKFDISDLDKELLDLESKSYEEILVKYNQKKLEGSLKTILSVSGAENWIDNVLKKFNTDKKEELKAEFFEISNFPDIK